MTDESEYEKYANDAYYIPSMSVEQEEYWFGSPEISYYEDEYQTHEEETG